MGLRVDWMRRASRQKVCVCALTLCVCALTLWGGGASTKSLSFHTMRRRGLGSRDAGAGGGMLEASFNGLFNRHSQSRYHVPAAQPQKRTAEDF